MSILWCLRFFWRSFLRHSDDSSWYMLFSVIMSMSKGSSFWDESLVQNIHHDHHAISREKTTPLFDTINFINVFVLLNRLGVIQNELKGLLNISGAKFCFLTERPNSMYITLDILSTVFHKYLQISRIYSVIRSPSWRFLLPESARWQYSVGIHFARKYLNIFEYFLFENKLDVLFKLYDL